MKFEKVNCLLCGKDNLASLVNIKGRHGQIFVSICKNDGMVFLNPRWIESKYKQYYEGTYFKENKYRAKKMSEAVVKKYLARVGKYMPAKVNTILDIGSARGDLFNVFQRVGKKVRDAIEPDKKMQKELIKRKINIVADDVNSDWHLTRKGKYAFIVMRHILEHLLDPRQALEKVRYVIADKAVLYLAVPNIMSIPIKATANQYFRPAHVSYFNKRTLANIMNNAGFTCLSMVAEGSELYGVFEKGEKQQVLIDDENYKNQKVFIDQFLKRKI